MSTKIVSSVYDSKAAAFLAPIFTVTSAVALRAFTQAANDSGHDFSRYAGDYTLFELGTFDEQNAKFDLHATPQSVALASTVIRYGEDQ